MNKMIDFLVGRGTRRMVGDVLRENRAMRELAGSLGFVVEPTDHDADALRFVLTLAQPAQPSEEAGQ